MNATASILAARFQSELTSVEQVRRLMVALVDSRVDSNDLVVWGAILLGATCGVLGCFVVLRRQSLLGDAIGHAVLPGVCLGFIAAGSRSGPALMVGAMVAGLLAAALIGVLQRTTNLKAGECMGVVFTGFYGLGIVLLKWIQNTGQSGQSGLDKFLFGQIAALSATDVACMAVVAVVAVGVVVAFWRPLAVASFDEAFAFSVGIPVRAVHYLLTVLLTVAIVISIQAVGVVLVAAMLVTPAATAYLMTDRLYRMAILSGVFGAIAGVVGTVLSVGGDDIPTGAFMVLGASVLFAAAFLLSPRHGVLPRVVRVWERKRRTQTENLLRTLYIMLEKRAQGSGVRVQHGDGQDLRFGVSDIAGMRQEGVGQVRWLARLARRRGWVEERGRDVVVLTPAGLEEARRVVRNHRLWELFLTQEAHLAADHVHADAEYIEHVLPKDVLRRLEEMLERPTVDPHGRPIPSAGTAGGAA